MKADVKIEPGALRDIGKIFDLEKTCFGPDAFSRRQLRYLLARAKGLFLIAKAGETVAGYIMFLVSKRHNTGRIYSIAVAPDYRSCGLGEKLLDSTLEYASQLKLGAVFLEVRENNSQAISLYTKKNFSVRHIKEAYYADGTGAYSMVLDLHQTS